MKRAVTVTLTAVVVWGLLGCEGPSGGGGYVVENADGSGRAVSTFEFGGERRDTAAFEETLRE